ncbi:hypothetical protein [Desulfosporosinus meridiei]|uniref:hypothetical protein n=1 Tax=Desulfosporosinus meridiei TaxID=79209 RepID=UPI0002DEB62E|nr:hypothetical protein [Desulfosporosinus meridiei]
MQGDVYIKEGTPIYEVEQFNELNSVALNKTPKDVRGRIEKREGSFVNLMAPGGWYFWVEDKYLIFPKVEEEEIGLIFPLLLILLTSSLSI